jgi:2'-5' RNA ligase
MRSFISVDIPEKVKREIVKIQRNLPEFSGKKTDTENLHLTLKFLGEVDEEKIGKIKERLGSVKPEKFETEIDEIGVFSERFIRIVWLHMKNCDNLQKQVDEKLRGLFEEERRFMSHLTIARVKNIKNKREFLEEIKKIKIPKIKFVVDRFYLMKSELTAEGPRYSVLEEFKLE